MPLKGRLVLGFGQSYIFMATPVKKNGKFLTED